MKQLAILLVGFLIVGKVYADIAPRPIVIKGIYTVDSCNIQMTQEYVYADLYNDSSRVECTFELLNLGDSITIQVGFPEMNFQYWSLGGYSYSDIRKFQIQVDNTTLTRKQIKVPDDILELYKGYMLIDSINDIFEQGRENIIKKYNISWGKRGKWKCSSINIRKKAEQELDSLVKWYSTKQTDDSDLRNLLHDYARSGINPWYVWDVHFNKNEKKTIKVIYSLPSGIGNGAEYRYFNYILETGSGWHGLIEQADIELKLHDINMETIEEISPTGYQIDTTEKNIKWNFLDLEPTNDDDIYLRYYNVEERRRRELFLKKRKRAIWFRRLNPINWFR